MKEKKTRRRSYDKKFSVFNTYNQRYEIFHKHLESINSDAIMYFMLQGQEIEIINRGGVKRQRTVVGRSFTPRDQ